MAGQRMDESLNQLTTARRRDPPPDHLATADRRQLPDFVIIGAQRGGTTSLYRYLIEHPDIEPASRKEVHFFDGNYERGMDWYRAHFPLQGASRLTGEASPSYLFAPAAPARIRAALPQARYIALLRNPVDRAFSHYQLMVKRGIEPLSFEEAIAAEPERLTGTGDPFTLAWRHFSYIRRGLYAEQLERWLASFPREQLLVLKSEDFYAEPAATLRQTQAWLGLPARLPATLTAHQVGDYVGMSSATRERLGDYFAPSNRRLYDLLVRDLGWE
jgi:hypothetical protein